MKPLLWMRAVRDAKPTASRLAVLLCLGLRMREDGTGFASTRQLADDATVSEWTVMRATKWARAEVLLIQVQRGHRLGNGRTMATRWQLSVPGESLEGVANEQSQPGTGDTLSDSQPGRTPSQPGATAAPEVCNPELSSKTNHSSSIHSANAGPTPSFVDSEHARDGDAAANGWMNDLDLDQTQPWKDIQARYDAAEIDEFGVSDLIGLAVGWELDDHELRTVNGMLGQGSHVAAIRNKIAKDRRAA